MNVTEQAIGREKEKKKGFLGKFLSFLMYGGFLVVVAVGLAIVILVDLYIL